MTRRWAFVIVLAGAAAANAAASGPRQAVIGEALAQSASPQTLVAPEVAAAAQKAGSPASSAESSILSGTTSVRTYPLDLDFRTVRSVEFKRLGPTHIGIYAVRRAENDLWFEVDDLVSHAVLNPKELKQLYPQNTTVLYPNPRNSDMGWNTDNTLDDHIIRADDGTTITFLTSSWVTPHDSVNFYNEYFWESCLDPAASFMRIERRGVVEEKVLLYVFRKPVALTPAFRCEEELFAPPHASARIVAPVLTAASLPDGTVLLAGASYVAMPIVIAVPPHFRLSGDGSSFFVVDKKEVDRIRQSAADEYQAIQREAVAEHKRDPQRYPLKAFTGADLAALIEKRLLEYLNIEGN
ncbi:MAG: hypothetical protein ACLQJR_12195 [Stellaceae bacterium]